ncbi:MAG: MFS transporter, partial [Porticoccaceae bacterium]
MACWVIGYGLIQAFAPKITGDTQQLTPTGSALTSWVAKLAFIPALIAAGLAYGLDPTIILIAGLLTYGGVFAINSSIHSFLIVAFSKRDSVSTDVGFYYMANAAGRLTGTLLSGLIYQQQGLVACLVISSAMVVASALISARISR